VFDRRTACLDHRLAALDATLATLTAATADVDDRATDVVAALPPIEDCSDLARLAAAPAEPEDPALRMRIAKLDADVATRMREVETLVDRLRSRRIA